VGKGEGYKGKGGLEGTEKGRGRRKRKKGDKSTPTFKKGRGVHTGNFDGCSAVDFSGEIFGDTLVHSVVHVDAVLDVECPVVESFAHRFHAMRPGNEAPVLLELNSRIRNAEHAAFQLSVLVEVENLVLERLQECRRICTDQLASSLSLHSAPSEQITVQPPWLAMLLTYCS